MNATAEEKTMTQGLYFDVIIIGGGPAGASAAIYTARAGLSTLVIDKGLTAGALGMTGKIANYPGLAAEISGAELLETMRHQARAFGAELAEKTGLPVDFSDERGTTITAHGFLNETNTRGKRRKATVDAVAATIILQDYLDYRRNRKG